MNRNVISRVFAVTLALCVLFAAPAARADENVITAERSGLSFDIVFSDDAFSETSRFSFAAAGDVLIHSTVYKAARVDGGYDFAPMFRLIKERVSSSDAAFCNQETILGGTELGLSTYPCFNSPQEVGDAVRGAGFNIVSLANNHTLDRGVKAIKSSLAYWARFPEVTTAGSYASLEDAEAVHTFTVRGVKCSFLAYTTLTNGIKIPGDMPYGVAVYSDDAASADIARARGVSDVVIVSMHWGQEYVFKPTAEQKRIAKHLAAAGADIIAGHHPHVVQPVCMEGDTLVMYSLGNLISGQKELQKKIGLLMSFDVAVKRRAGERALVTFENVTATLLYNPSRSKFGRYVVIPFDMVTNKILKDYKKVYKTFSAHVKIDDVVTMAELGE